MGKFLWRHEPPEASAEDWARVWDRLVGLAPIDEEGEVSEQDQLLLFVLDDAIGRCRTEAENREPGILGRRLRTQLQNSDAWMGEFTD